MLNNQEAPLCFYKAIKYLIFNPKPGQPFTSFVYTSLN